MAKSDFICANCKKVRGQNPNARYTCGECGYICRKCVNVRGGILSKTTRYCKTCKNGVLKYEFNPNHNRWEKA